MEGVSGCCADLCDMKCAFRVTGVPKTGVK